MGSGYFEPFLVACLGHRDKLDHGMCCFLHSHYRRIRVSWLRSKVKFSLACTVSHGRSTEVTEMSLAKNILRSREKIKCTN